MKKNITIALILFLLVGIGVGVYLNFFKPSLSATDILPEGPLVYVQFSDVTQNVEALSANPIFQVFSQLPYHQLFQPKNSQNDQTAWMDALKAQLFDPSTQSLLKKFFGLEVTMAIYQADINWASLAQASPDVLRKAFEDLLSNVFIVTRVGKDVQFADLISGFFGAKGNNYTVETQDYRKHKIYTVVLNNPSLKVSLVRINDLMVMGISDHAAISSLDYFLAKKQSTLAHDGSFIKAQKRFFPKATFNLYGNSEKFFLVLKEQASRLMQAAGEDSLDVDGEKKFNENMEAFYNRVAGFKTLGVSFLGGDLAQMKVDIFLDKAVMEPSRAQYYSNCKPVDNATIHFIPRDVLGYQWNGCFDLAYSWGEIKKQMSRFPEAAQDLSLDERISSFEKNIGLSIESDILPAFGREIGGFLKTVDVSETAPIPQLVIFIKVADQNKMDSLLAKLNDQAMFQVLVEDYSGTTIRYFVSPTAQKIQPAYAFVNGYLIFAVDRQLIKETLDALGNSSMALGDTENFKAVNPGLADKSTNVIYIKMNDLAQKIKSFVEWSNEVALEKEDKQRAFQAGREKRLSEVKTNIEQWEGERKELESRRGGLESTIAVLKSNNQDISIKANELSLLQEQIASKDKDISSAQGQLKDLELMVKNLQERAVDPEVRQKQMNDVIFPILRSFESMGAIGSRTTLEEDVMETLIHLKK